MWDQYFNPMEPSWDIEERSPEENSPIAKKTTWSFTLPKNNIKSPWKESSYSGELSLAETVLPYSKKNATTFIFSV